MNDEFLTRFRKQPHAEFAEALYQKINQPVSRHATRSSLLLIAASAATLLLIMALLFTHPRLQAFAQQILQFFFPAQSETFTLPAQEAAPRDTPTPTFAAPVLAGCEDASTSLTYDCSVGGAEAALAFDVRELPSDPEGYTFAGASADPAQDQITLTYARPGSELAITQGRGLPEDSAWEASWGAVPPDAVERVQVNGFDGEYVRGIYVVKSQNGTEAVWEPDAPFLRLRWREGELRFEIQLGGLTGDDRSIGKDWLISLAESLK